MVRKIILGDCLKVMHKIKDKSINMILCDMPYGTTACKWDFILPLDKLWEHYKRIIKDNGAIVLTASQPFTTDLINSNRKWFKYCLVWNKRKGGNPLLSKVQPIRITEDIVIFGNGKVNYYPIMINRDKPKKRGRNRGNKSEITGNAFIENKIYTQKYPKNIIEISNANQKEKIHPTQKPVALFEYLIQTYTNRNNLVLDNCAGSGTTGIACINLNRNFILIEKDKKYYEIMRKRIKEALNQWEK